MEEIERYKHLNKYLKEKFGERTLKVCRKFDTFEIEKLM